MLKLFESGRSHMALLVRGSGASGTPTAGGVLAAGGHAAGGGPGAGSMLLAGGQGRQQQQQQQPARGTLRALPAALWGLLTGAHARDEEAGAARAGVVVAPQRLALGLGGASVACLSGTRARPAGFT